jgi:D-tyrosyl-tRNA(Tyr) deacylase
MKLIIQRVKNAAVRIEGKVVGEIGVGLLVLLGITQTDTRENADALIRKLINLRVFNDDMGRMNRSILDVRGSFLVVSQFTLYANTKKGNRPSFVDAAHPEHAIPLYEYFVENLKIQSTLQVDTGVFGAMMDVELTNSGPVTIVLEH